MWNLILDPLCQVNCMAHICSVIIVTIDKPTSDELVVQLTSSKFTSTWEEFVCNFLNIPQDIITQIKSRESPKEDTICAVAQHYLDNNPDATWRKIIDALLDSNEATVACDVLNIISGIKKSVCVSYSYHSCE